MSEQQQSNRCNERTYGLRKKRKKPGRKRKQHPNSQIQLLQLDSDDELVTANENEDDQSNSSFNANKTIIRSMEMQINIVEMMAKEIPHHVELLKRIHKLRESLSKYKLDEKRKISRPSVIPIKRRRGDNQNNLLKTVTNELKIKISAKDISIAENYMKLKSSREEAKLIEKLSIQIIQHPLYSYKILTNIMEKMDRNDLLRCRLVNSYWRDLSTEIILTKKNYVVELNYSKHHEGFVRARHPFSISEIQSIHEEEEEVKTLDELCKCIESSRKFPFPFNCFKFSGKLYLTDVEEFFALYGHKVKKLCFSHFKKNRFSMSALICFILPHTPNLEELEIDNIFIHQRTRPKYINSSTFYLPRLKSFVWDPLLSSQVVRIILQAAPNLQLFSFHDKFHPLYSQLQCNDNNNNNNNNHHHHPIELKDLIKLKKLNFELTKKKLAVYEKIAEHKNFLQLTSISFETGQPPMSRNDPDLYLQVLPIISHFFESSGPYLEEINGLELFGFIPGVVKIPSFPAVTKLTMNIFTPPYFEPRSTLHTLSSLTFPNLRILDISLPGTLQPDELAPYIHVVTTVEELSIVGGDSVWMEFFHKRFPSVKRLELKDVLNFVAVAHSIWNNFTRIKSLELVFESSEFPQYIDEILTGFSTETCLTIQNGHGPKDLAEMEQLRVNPSILQLKDLESLTIEIPRGNGGMEKPFVPTFWTRIATLYALNWMPNLKILTVRSSTGRAEIKAAFTSLASHITVIYYDPFSANVFNGNFI